MSENYLSELMLGDVAHIIDPHPSHRAPPEVREGVPFAGIGDISEAGELLPGKGRVVSKGVIYEHSLRYKISSNTVGFGRVASIGKVIDFRRNEENLAISPTMAIVEPFDIDKDFLIATLKGSLVRGKIDQWLTGSTRSSLGIELLREVPIPSFDKEAQKKIGAIYRSIVSAIEKTEALIAKYKQIKAGLMQDFFTRGIGRDGKLRPPREQAPGLYKETPIGWIPKEWVLASFGSKIDVIDPNPSHRYPDSVDYGCPICSTENFIGADSFSIDRAKTVPEMTFLLQNARCQFTPDDVIFARKGKIGLARRYGKDKKVFSHTVVVMKPLGNEVSARWLLWLARSNWLISGIEKTMNTNLGVPTLGVEFIKKIPVPFPSLEEQKAADGALQAITDKLGAVETELKKLKEKKSGLMHDLLTGGVSVSVEPKEERAVETA